MLIWFDRNLQPSSGLVMYDIACLKYCLVCSQSPVWNNKTNCVSVLHHQILSSSVSIAASSFIIQQQFFFILFFGTLFPLLILSVLPPVSLLPSLSLTFYLPRWFSSFLHPSSPPVILLFFHFLSSPPSVPPSLGFIAGSSTVTICSLSACVASLLFLQ